MPPITWRAPRPYSAPTGSNAASATCTPSPNRSRPATRITRTSARRSWVAIPVHHARYSRPIRFALSALARRMADGWHTDAQGTRACRCALRWLVQPTRRETLMPRGDKSSYTDKQKRKAEHIEEGYEERGVGKKEAERRAWATVNKETGGGNKSGSGRGVPDTKVSSKRGGRIGGPRGGKASASRPAAARSRSARKAAATRKRKATASSSARKTTR